MKKRILCCLFMTVLVCSGCGNAEEKNPPKAMPRTEIATEEEQRQTEAAQPQTEAVEPSAPERQLVTIDADLSPLGEFIGEFGVITNDESKKPAKEEVFEYIKGKGWDFYPYQDADDDKIITPEEAFEDDMFYIKPAFITDYSGDKKYSFATVTFNEHGKLSVIQYNFKDYTPNTPDGIRNTFNTIIENSFEGKDDIEIRYGGKEKDNWIQLWITFLGDSAGETNFGDYGNIQVYLNSDNCLFSINLY